MARTRKPGWERERLLALEGNATHAISDMLGKSEGTIHWWINKFRSAEVEGLLTKEKGNGSASRLTPEMEEGMKEQLRLGKWRTGRDAWKWLSENYETGELKESVIYKYLGKCKGRLKATRPCNPKKDQSLEDEFRTTLADKMKALNIPKTEQVKLWVYDEMRYGLHPLTHTGCVVPERGQGASTLKEALRKQLPLWSARGRRRRRSRVPTHAGAQ